MATGYPTPSFMLFLASITDKVVEAAVDVVGSLGLAGIFLLMVPESACIPVPSEPTMLAAGFNASQGHYSWVVAGLVGATANVIGSWIAYAAGYYGRIDLLEKQRFVHLRPGDLQRADRWFERYGEAAVFFSRLLPIVRTFISLPAGVARMPFWRFTAFTVAGCVPWMLGLSFIGFQAGENWTTWKNRFHYVDYFFAALIVLAIVLFVVRWRRRRGTRAAAETV
ncbi:MAG: DedA family protein [Thermoleophilaceae bacterium]|jgi:membrane protein DedA with SNARE-associated domain